MPSCWYELNLRKYLSGIYENTLHLYIDDLIYQDIFL